jgi:hypothetical protein
LLSSANFPITTAIRFLSNLEISASFISPTKTGLEKSIMDAHGSLRDLLVRTGVHDFQSQEQGPDGKRILPIFLHSTAGTIESKISLYRPETKGGDPRVWISGFGRYAKATDLIAICVGNNKQLNALNFSEFGIEAQLTDLSSDLARAMTKIKNFDKPDTTAVSPQKSLDDYVALFRSITENSLSIAN